jgi:hypothetical protein
MMTDQAIYAETVSSKATETLFISLMALFVGLLFWRVSTTKFDLLAGVFAFLCVFFLFYVLNYRKLLIRLTSESLNLKFGMFSWSVPLENIAACELDELPAVFKYGGAGIHFMFVHRKYRVSLNFLEHPRVVVTLKQKQGLVQEVSFSTRHPTDLLSFLCTAVEEQEAKLLP